jgi:hypothetical protein
MNDLRSLEINKKSVIVAIFEIDSAQGCCLIDRSFQQLKLEQRDSLFMSKHPRANNIEGEKGKRKCLDFLSTFFEDENLKLEAIVRRIKIATKKGKQGSSI